MLDILSGGVTLRDPKMRP